MSSFGMNIKKLRTQEKLSHEEMANKLLVSSQTVLDWEDGKEQPDIDTLIRLADILDMDVDWLIYDIDSKKRDQERKHFFISCGILIGLLVIFYFLNPIAYNRARSSFFMGRLTLVHFCLLPIIWLVVGWTVMQCLSILGVIKSVKSKFNKPLRIATLVIVLSYAIIMLPFIIATIDCMIKLYQFNQTHTNGNFEYAFEIPTFLRGIAFKIMAVVQKHPAIFAIPSMIYWLFKPHKAKKKKVLIEP